MPELQGLRLAFKTDRPSQTCLAKKPEYKKSASTKTPQPEQHILPLPSLEDQL